MLPDDCAFSFAEFCGVDDGDVLRTAFSAEYEEVFPAGDDLGIVVETQGIGGKRGIAGIHPAEFAAFIVRAKNE